MRDYGVPSIAGLLHETGEFEHDGMKRYDDTILIGQEATVDGIDSERGHAAVRRLNRIHGHYDIPNDERLRAGHHHRRSGALDLALRLAPARPARARRDHPGDHALRRADGHQGPAHDVRRLPGAARRYERAHFAPTPAGHAVAEATIAIGSSVVPAPLRPLVRRVSIAIMDEPLRDRARDARQPRPASVDARGLLRARPLLEEFRHCAPT